MQLGIDQVYDVRVSRTSTGLDIYTNDVVTIYDTAYSDVLTVFHDLDTFIHGYDQLCAIRDAMYRFPNNPALEYLFGADFREKYGLEDDNQSTSSDSSSDKKDDDKKDDKKDDSKDKTLWQRFCDFIKRIWQKIKDFFSGTKTEKKEDDKTPATNEPINKILNGVSKQTVPPEIQERVKKLDNEDEKNWFIIFYKNVKTSDGKLDAEADNTGWAGIRKLPAKHINPELIVKIKDWSTKIVSLLCDEKTIRAMDADKLNNREALAEFVGVKPLEKYINDNQSLTFGDIPSGTAWDEVENLRKYQSDLEHLLKTGWAAAMEKEIEKVIPSDIGDCQIVSAWKRFMGDKPFNKTKYMQTVRAVLETMVKTVNEFQQAIKNYEVVTAIVKGAEVYEKLKKIEEKADNEAQANQNKTVAANAQQEVEREETVTAEKKKVAKATNSGKDSATKEQQSSGGEGEEKQTDTTTEQTPETHGDAEKTSSTEDTFRKVDKQMAANRVAELLNDMNNKTNDTKRNAAVDEIVAYVKANGGSMVKEHVDRLKDKDVNMNIKKYILKSYNITNLFSLFEEDTTDMTTWW